MQHTPGHRTSSISQEIGLVACDWWVVFSEHRPRYQMKSLQRNPASSFTPTPNRQFRACIQAMVPRLEFIRWKLEALEHYVIR
jgi:hypothetical protein